VSHRRMLGRAGSSRAGGGGLRRRLHGAMPHCRMFGGTRRSWRCGRRRRRRHRAVTHRRVLRRAGRCWRWSRRGSHRPRRRRRWHGAMAHRSMLGCAAYRWHRRWGGRRRLSVPAILSHSRRSGCRGQKAEDDALHAASPSSGRTVTTRIIPACMW
jgi:hypothetical protein